MDIDLLSKMVKELILDSDRVVLPGLGSFVAEIVPSSFSDKGYTINPPYRRLYFRSKPDQGSELADFYASGNQIDPEVAAKIISDFVAELKSVLHSKKVVVFPGLGRLRATKENNIFFIADADLDIYPAGFGLEPISLKTHQETPEEVSAAVVGLRSLLTETPVQPEQTQDQAGDLQPADVQLPVEQDDSVLPDDENAEAEIEEKQQEPQPEPASEPSLKQTLQDEMPVRKISGKKVFIITICVLLALVALLLAALAVAGRLYPEFVDRFLYTPEELEILNKILK
jgi:nucleoid DNA-binding protein